MRLTVTRPNAHPLRYIDKGQGDVLLFLHGILGDARIWQPHCHRLSPHYRTLAYSQRGFGADNHHVTTQTFNVDIHSQDLIDFCETLKLERVTLVAWSYACHCGLLAALKRPQLFKQLLLYDLIVPSYGMDNADKALFSKDLSSLMTPIIQYLRQQQQCAAADAFIRATSNNDQTLLHAIKYALIKQDNHHTLPLLLSQPTPREISAEALQTLSTRLVIATGNASRPLFNLASKAAARASNIPLQTIAGAHHFWPISDIEAFCSFIVAQLNQRTKRV